MGACRKHQGPRWGSLPIKAAQLSQIEKAGPRDVRCMVLEEGSIPQPWCIEWGVMLWAPRAILWAGFGTLDVSGEADLREQHRGRRNAGKSWTPGRGAEASQGRCIHLTLELGVLSSGSASFWLC